MRVWFNKIFSNVHGVLELIRRGDRAGEFELVCSHPHEGFPGFLAAHEHALEPGGLAGEAYVEFCLAFCRERLINIFVPGKEADLIAEHAARFAEQGVRVLAAASPATLRLLNNKARCYAEAWRFSVPPPAFLEFSTATEFDAAYARLRARHAVLCVKPVEGVCGIGFRVIDERRGALELLLKGLTQYIPLDDLRRCLASAECFQTMLLMEYLDGPEYSADCVGDGQRLVQCVQRRKPQDGSYGQTIVSHPAIMRTLEEMTEAYRLGFFNAQFREGREGLRLLEINPRFSGGVAMSCATGVNLPYLALRGFVHGFENHAPVALKVGARVAEIPRAQVLEGVAP
jgi:biotin carboxylase